MEAISIQKLAEFVGSDLRAGAGRNGVISGVSTDSRQIKAGDCFFAIKGANFDGHSFVEEVFSRGASCAVVEKSFQAGGNFDGKCVLGVTDTVEAMGNLARRYRRELNCKVIAVTGSAGKTTTRQLISHILGRKFKCLEAQKSFNNAIGVPLTILSADNTHEVLVLELGSNHPGEIEYLSLIAQPDIALITNIYPAHLEGFGSIRGVMEEKASISKGLKGGGKLIVNGEFAELVRYCKDEAKQSEAEIITFGTTRGCDIFAERMECGGISGEFVVDGVKITIPLAGKANIENALAAYAACRQLGVSAEEFSEGIATVAAVNMRMQIFESGKHTILSDCYNANPASMANAIDCLGRLGAGGKRRLVFICGPMKELGKDSEYFHTELGKKIADAGVGLLVAVGEYAAVTTEAAKKAADYRLEAEIFENADLVCDSLENLIKTDDIILVKGSRAARLETVVEKLRNLTVS